MILDVQNLEVAYQKKQVVYGVSISVQEREFISLIGHNGAGKTTVLKSIFGLIKAMGGKVIFKGENIINRSVPANVKEGLSFMHQEKAIFPNLSVLENLELGGYLAKEIELKERLQGIYNIFPILQERKMQLAGTLSGGEQKQLALAMALMLRPKLLMLDEPSLGLSPIMIKELERVLKEIQSMGMAILLVEQNVKMAISLAERTYVMKMGQIIHEDSQENMLKREQLWDLF